MRIDRMINKYLMINDDRIITDNGMINDDWMVIKEWIYERMNEWLMVPTSLVSRIGYIIVSHTKIYFDQFIQNIVCTKKDLILCIKQ